LLKLKQKIQISEEGSKVSYRRIERKMRLVFPIGPYDLESDEPPCEKETAYVTAVKQLLLARACVRPSFSVADERLARGWFERGIPLAQIEKTILFACSRKYIAWRNGQSKTLINSLRYFESTLDEIRGQKIDPEYWSFIRFRMQRVEKLWLQSKAHSTTPAPESETEKQPEDTPAKTVQEVR
jgi:hypothetical protein